MFDISSLEPLSWYSQDFDHSAVDSQSWRDPWSEGTLETMIAACSVRWCFDLDVHVTWCKNVNHLPFLMNMDWSIPSTCSHQYQSDISQSNALTFLYNLWTVSVCFLGFQLFLSFHPAFLSPRCQELRELSMDSWASWVMSWPWSSLKFMSGRHLSEFLKWDEDCKSAWSVLQHLQLA